MPAVTSATEEENKEEKMNDLMWTALKKHIIRERQRKKEEHEAEVEEERLRKEKERQDVMTLGETREQIKHIENKLFQLKARKHELFLQLKKLLNEDGNRKKQQNKDSNEMLANINGMMPGENIVQAPIIVPQKVSQGSPIITRPINTHVHNNKSASGSIKRGRSPSPTYGALDTPYSHNHHKQSHPQHSQGPQHKKDDRSRDMTRAVLWNKPSHYNTGGGGASFYPVQSQGEQRAPPLLYTGSLYQQMSQQMPPKPIVMNLGESQGNEYSRQAPPPGVNSLPSQRHTPQLLPGQVQVQVHPSVGPQQLQHNSVQNSKPGGITSGYPVRQQNPTIQNSNLYPSRHRY